MPHVGCGSSSCALPRSSAVGRLVWPMADLESLGGKVLLIPGERRGRMLPTATQSMFI